MSCFLGSPSEAVWAALWYARSLATRSVESLAALTESVLGMTRRAAANSAMASCSREPWRTEEIGRIKGQLQVGGKVEGKERKEQRLTRVVAKFSR